MNHDKIRVLLGHDQPQDIIGRAIARFTWLHPVCHSKAAFWFPDGRYQIWESRRDCGVIKRDPDPEGRDRYTIWTEVDLPNPEAALAFAYRQEGKDYDNPFWKFLFRVTEESRKASGRWFCSEFIFQLCAEGGLRMLRILKAFMVSPSLLFSSPLQDGPFEPPWRM